ncbi:proline reductase-associated electron transfer protein PrdC [Listeria monocytogenes]|nr:proline reductase-associated electron transfer protein PrdC [Listeria monocytogenes]MBC2238699.1 proline reductase-associated electron transfer protein PrdC [Listeria innocua]HBC0573980.1 proline reductase-associated electron transfer protein PrdC [Listeria monocytogenes]
MTNFQIPLKQHVGAPCKPVIAIGDYVEKGQLIAKPAGLGANIHASVSGEIIAISETAIEIQLAEVQSDTFVPIAEQTDHLAMIEEAGVVGAGGAGFPTYVKLSTKIIGGYLIANAAECEPLLAHNIKQIEENAEQLVRGLKYMIEITEAKKAYFAIKTKYRTAMYALGKAVKNEPLIEVKYLPDMYPAGDERVIIRELLGITLKPGQLPIEANAIVSNVETIKHVAEAIELRKPCIEKDITVSGRVQQGSHVFENVPIGTPVKLLIDAAGGYVEPHGEIVIGGPFTGSSGEEATPVNKTTGGVLVSMPFPQENRKIGILICECGGGKARLEEIAHNMGAEVVSEQRCKRMVEVNGRYRCDLPGVCPGQAEKVMQMKKDGAEVVLTGTCQD